MLLIDLFARDGDRPRDLEGALARKSDLMFANQTWQRLEAFCRGEDPRANASRAGMSIYYLSYRPDPSEAGPERLFDYSDRSIESRWAAGEADMSEALAPRHRRPRGATALIPIRRESVSRAARRAASNA